MASFEPGSINSDAGNLPRFNPPRLDSTAGALFSGIGDALKTAVTGADNFFKNSINDEADAKVNIVRDTNNAQVQAILNPQGVQVAAANGTPIPDAIQDKTTQAQGITLAKGMGKMNESNYEAQMDLITKSLRSQYPGYKEFIDETMHKMTGQIPANALHKALDAQLNAAATNPNSPANRIAHQEDFAAKEGIFIPNTIKNIPDVNQRLEATNYYVSQQFAWKADTQGRLASAKVAEAEHTVNQQVTTDNYNVMGNRGMTDFFNRMQDSPEGQAIKPLMDQIKSQSSAMNETTRTGGLVNPEDRYKLISNVRQAEQIFNTQFLAPFEAKFGTNVTDQTRENFRKVAQGYFQMYTKGLDGAPGLLQAADDTLKANTDFAAGKLLQENPEMNRFHIITSANVMPKEVAAALAINPSVGTPLGRSAALYITTGVIGGDFQSMDAALAKLNTTYKQNDPALTREAIGKVRDATFAKGVTDQGVKSGFSALYGPNNINMFKNLPDPMQIDAYTNLYNNTTMDNINKLAEKGKITQEDRDNAYRGGYANGQKLLTNAIFDLNNTSVFRDNKALVYNDKTGFLEIKPRVPSPDQPASGLVMEGLRQGAKIADSIPRMVQDKASEAALGKANRVLTAIDAMARADGDDPKEVARKFLQASNVQLNAAKQQPGGLENFVQGLDKQLQENPKMMDVGETSPSSQGLTPEQMSQTWEFLKSLPGAVSKTAQGYANEPTPEEATIPAEHLHQLFDFFKRGFTLTDKEKAMQQR